MINGQYSHAVLKRAKNGDFRVQDDYGGSVESYCPNSIEHQFCETIIDVLPFKPIYARLDIIRDNSNNLALSELELIEPEMWFRESLTAHKSLVATIRSCYF